MQTVKILNRRTHKIWEVADAAIIERCMRTPQDYKVIEDFNDSEDTVGFYTHVDDPQPDDEEKSAAEYILEYDSSIGSAANVNETEQVDNTNILSEDVTKMSFEELKAYAQKNGIDIGNATTAAGILKKIEASKTPENGASENKTPDAQ